ncbi:MAG: nuclear transport factor 2 family protein [Myxococcota bacterium]
MSAKKVGDRFVAMIRDHQFMPAIQELYADDVVSVEAMSMGGRSPETRGKPAVVAKSEWWDANHELHSMEVEGPFPHGGDRFAVIYRIDVTSKVNGGRSQMAEVAVYTVADKQITREEYFYGA